MSEVQIKKSSGLVFTHAIEISIIVGAFCGLADATALINQQSDIAQSPLSSVRLVNTSVILTSIAFLLYLIPAFLFLKLISLIIARRIKIPLSLFYFVALVPVAIIIAFNITKPSPEADPALSNIQQPYALLRYLMLFLPVCYAISFWMALLRERVGSVRFSGIASSVILSVSFILILIPVLQHNLIFNSAIDETSRFENRIIIVSITLLGLILLYPVMHIASFLARTRLNWALAISWLLVLFVPFYIPPREISTPVNASKSGSVLDSRASNVILISLDTTRHDSLGCFGSEIVRSPALDSVAEESIRFEKAITPMPVTGPAHITMLTGLQPVGDRGHGVGANGIRLDDHHITLAEILDSEGYSTAAIIGASPLSRGACGLQNGFHYYHDIFNRSFTQKLHTGYTWSLTANRVLRRLLLAFGLDRFWVSKTADIVTDEAIEWLDKNYSDPFFLFIHYYDPHEPLEPPEPYLSMYEPFIPTPSTNSEENEWDYAVNFAKYRGEISFMDNELKRFLNRLDELELYDNTLLIIVADHGESFEHDYYGHRRRVFDKIIHVPLMIRHPEMAEAGIKGISTDSLVNISDIFYTILNFLEIQPPFD
ncbi:MAG TPA: hypothetical protein ENN67_09120, partial [Firmicutes bacterium]|nr:hypothetical protein [Bacillota bacterium]